MARCHKTHHWIHCHPLCELKDLLHYDWLHPWPTELLHSQSVRMKWGEWRWIGWDWRYKHSSICHVCLCACSRRTVLTWWNTVRFYVELFTWSIWTQPLNTLTTLYSPVPACLSSHCQLTSDTVASQIFQTLHVVAYNIFTLPSWAVQSILLTVHLSLCSHIS